MDEEEEAAPAPAILTVEGDAAGMRWLRELQTEQNEKHPKIHFKLARHIYTLCLDILYTLLWYEVRRK